MFSAAKTAAAGAAYNINNSVRLRSSASAYFNRTPGSAGNRQIFTWSGWVKRGALGATDFTLFSAGTTSPSYDSFRFTSDALQFFQGAGATSSIQTTQLFRDPSAWYHIVLAVDTTQATASNRIKIYVNGSQVTALSSASYPAQNTSASINNTLVHAVGALWITSAQQYFDGYLTEINFIDGQALTPSSFGSTNATTGVWQPAKYTGTYGTNGFYLNFSSIATTSGSNAGLGKDFSGNTNYWNTNNISVTSGVTYDAMIDSPTLSTAGTQPVGNYSNINPLSGSTIGTIDNGNLRLYYNGANWSRQISTIGMTTSKWYAEFTISQIGDNSWQVGVTSSIPTRDSTNQNGEISGSSFLNAYQSFVSGASIWNNTTRSSLGVTYANGDVIGVAFDADTATVKYYRNGSQVGTTSGYVVNTIGSVWYFQCFSKSTDSTGSYGIVDANFGQRPFSYTPPSGYVALCTTNLPTSTIVQGNKYMDATLWTGNGASTVTVTNASGFKPDLVWAKQRNIAQNHTLIDSVRGAGYILNSDTTAADYTATTYGQLTAFNSNGFTGSLGSNGTYSYFNINAGTYVGWQWQAGQGSTSSNTSGTITSTVSVNTTAGFSIVTFTSNNTGGATVGHGLGIKPSMIILKRRGGVSDWDSYHISLGATKGIGLNTSSAATTSINYWNNTEPTSSVFTLGAGVNPASIAMVAYCWAEIAGFSKIGSYTGNGSADGPFVYCGFQPAYVIIKNTTSGTGYDWEVYDNKRLGYNLTNSVLYPDLSNAEATAAGIDILSNGFKLRVAGSNNNPNGATMIFMAFASNPFKNTLAR